MKRWLLALLLLVWPASAGDVVMMGYGAAPSGWVALNSFGTANQITTGGLLMTTSSALELGHVAVCAVAKNETTTGTTDSSSLNQWNGVADDTGGDILWTKAGEWCKMGTSTAADGVCTAVWFGYPQTLVLASGGSIAFGVAGSPTAKAGTCWEFSAPGLTITVAAGVSNSSTSPTPSMSVATTVNQQHLFFRAQGGENDISTWTAGSGYTQCTPATSAMQTAATPDTAIGARCDFKIEAASTSTADAPTYGTFDQAGVMVGLDQAP